MTSIFGPGGLEPPLAPPSCAPSCCSGIITSFTWNAIFARKLALTATAHRTLPGVGKR